MVQCLRNITLIPSSSVSLPVPSCSSWARSRLPGRGAPQAPPENSPVGPHEPTKTRSVYAASCRRVRAPRNLGRVRTLSRYRRLRFTMLELFPWMPFAVPYALFCLAAATVSLLAYLQFRRATEQRVAPLVRRSPYGAMPPLLIAAVACSLFAVIVIAIDPGERLGAIVVAAATVVLGTIAWRICLRSGAALWLRSPIRIRS